MAIVKKSGFYLALGLCAGLGANTALADSPALQRTEQAASQVDLTRYISNDTDSMSRSLYLGQRPLSHEFEVESAGDYVIEVRAPMGRSGAYEVNAVLQNADGKVLARAKGDARSNGATIRRQLSPGHYEVVVTGQSEGPARERVTTVTATVRNADGESRTAGLAEANRVTRLAPAGSVERPARVAPQGTVEQDATLAGTGSAQRSASQTAAPDAPAPQPGPSGRALENAAASGGAGAAPTRDEEVAPARELIQQSVSFRAEGEVLRFEVVTPGVVTVESFTTADAGSYNLAAEVVDAEGNVVGRDRTRGFVGKFEIRERLQPGIYTVRVEASSGADIAGDTWTLRVSQDGE
ncbi:hypothetical protein [Kushneria aurantia]|uniref:Uncharacterized protein n=1 Tax=Kushneria aurantia TaxID=504092 RepID=A0ABV6G3T8_9GAMM|nr:hypothetical protein [Kushneria aurantia]